MTPFLCRTCGVQFAESAVPPAACPVCEDFRQYIGHQGQQWTTLPELRNAYSNQFTDLETGITAIHTTPKFAIGQRALLVDHVLWDCLSVLDDATIEQVQQRGGIEAIAISHPHYYSSMIEWSEAFGNVPILLHEDDRQWVMRPDPRIEFRTDETFAISPDLTLIRTGGHFEGAQVLHRRQNGGALFTGDVIQVVPDRRWVSFMRSYPNLLPLPAQAVRRIVGAIEPFSFERLYGAWPDFEILSDAKSAVERSAGRYIRSLREVLYEDVRPS